MSFASPLWLLALLLVPAALAAAFAARKRARRYAVRFPAASTLALAAGAEPIWRRRLPPALALAALAVLVLAIARPRTTVAVPIRSATIMLVTDHSGSMSADDVQPSRLAAAQSAARAFIAELPKQARLGIVAYSDIADATQLPSTNHDLTRQIIDAESALGSTATGDALQVAIDALRQNGGQTASHDAAIVLLSDGKTTAGRDPIEIARQAGTLHIPIYTVALGKEGATLPNPNPYGPPVSVAPDPETLGAIAQASGGHAFTASDEGRLNSIYKTLGSRLSVDRYEHREITAGFALGGLLLLVLAGAASLRMTGRLP